MRTQFYKTSEGEKFSVAEFSDKEIELLNYLIGEYILAESWVSFKEQTNRRIIEATKRLYGEKWSDSPLYKIQLDLVGNAGIRQGELEGELSDMLVYE